RLLAGRAGGSFRHRPWPGYTSALHFQRDGDDMELGLYTFAETTPDPRTGETIGAERRLANLLEEIELADEVGLDVFGVGEHHRPDYAVSAPAVVLAAAAARTKRIRLTSAVTVLS